MPTFVPSVEQWQNWRKLTSVRISFFRRTKEEFPPALQMQGVVTTLVIAALFNPLRHRVQSFIYRRFYRSKYDARKTLEAFSKTQREETDVVALNGDLVGVIREAMQPAHVSLWLRPLRTRRVQQISGRSIRELLTVGEFSKEAGHNS